MKPMKTVSCKLKDLKKLKNKYSFFFQCFTELSPGSAANEILAWQRSKREYNYEEFGKYERKKLNRFHDYWHICLFF